MKRYNQPHRKKERRQKVLERLKEQLSTNPQTTASGLEAIPYIKKQIEILEVKVKL